MDENTRHVVAGSLTAAYYAGGPRHTSSTSNLASLPIEVKKDVMQRAEMAPFQEVMNTYNRFLMLLTQSASSET